MQAALPHTDHFLPGNSLASLEALADLMETHRVRALVLAAGGARASAAQAARAARGRPLLAHAVAASSPPRTTRSWCWAPTPTESARRVDVGDAVVVDGLGGGPGGVAAAGCRALGDVDACSWCSATSRSSPPRSSPACRLRHAGGDARARRTTAVPAPRRARPDACSRASGDSRRRRRARLSRDCARRSRPATSADPTDIDTPDDLEDPPMKLEQSFDVAAPLEQVWEALIDLERVAPCLPGAEITDQDEDGNYKGTFEVKLGPTTANYRGDAEDREADEATHRAVLNARGTDKRGQGGATATIVNSIEASDGGGTRVDVDTDFTITGRLARFGRGGMIEDISNRLLRDFAACLQANLESALGRARDRAAEAAESATAAPMPAATPVRGGSLCPLRHVAALQASCSARRSRRGQRRSRQRSAAAATSPSATRQPLPVAGGPGRRQRAKRQRRAARARQECLGRTAESAARSACDLAGGGVGLVERRAHARVGLVEAAVARPARPAGPVVGQPRPAPRIAQPLLGPVGTPLGRARALLQRTHVDARADGRPRLRRLRRTLRDRRPRGTRRPPRDPAAPARTRPPCTAASNEPPKARLTALVEGHTPS